MKWKKEMVGIQLTAVIVAHADVVTNHVSHSPGNQVWLIRIYIHTYTNRLGRTDCIGNGHSGDSTREAFSTVNNHFLKIKSKLAPS